MRIYKINIEHKTFGRNFSTEKVAAPTFKQAVKSAEKKLNSRESIESVELIAATD